jgi:hypothetical protein
MCLDYCDLKTALMPTKLKTKKTFPVKILAGKKQQLNAMHHNISERLTRRHIVDSPHLDDLRIRIYGNTAIARNTYSVKIFRLK